MDQESAANGKATRPAKYRNLSTHKERMTERRAEQNLRIGYSNRNRDVVRRVQNFCEAMRAINVKNGVGSSKRRIVPAAVQ